MRLASKGGARYVLTFMDDFTRKSDIYLLKLKSEVLDTFIRYKAAVERQSGCNIKTIRTDNGGEFCNQKMDDYLRRVGIRHELTTVYTPQQNGGAERLNRTLVEKVRCLLRDSGLPEDFWGEAMLTANFLRNYVPTSICGDTVPIELWTGRKPSIRFLRVFGCRVYMRIPKPQWNGKFGPRAIKGILMGYAENHKAYRIWLEEEQAIRYSRDVKFLENVRGWEKQKVCVGNPDRVEDDYVIISFPDEVQERDVERILVPSKNDTSSIVTDVNIMSESETTCDDSNILNLEEDGMNLREEESQEESPRVVDSTSRTTEGDDTHKRWEQGRNLRERTPKVKPMKYSMATGIKKDMPSIEELTRQYGWNPDGDYW
jgi:hypothetical protein